jgi:hypothetical protein
MRGDRPGCQHVRDLGKALRRLLRIRGPSEGSGVAHDVVCRDVPLGEPPYVCPEDSGDKPAAGPEELDVTSDRTPAIEDVEDGVDTVRVRLPQQVGDVSGPGVIDLRSTEAPCLCEVSAYRRDYMGAARQCHLNRVASDRAGRSDHEQTLASDDAEELKRTEGPLSPRPEARPPARRRPPTRLPCSPHGTRTA